MIRAILALGFIALASATITEVDVISNPASGIVDCSAEIRCLVKQTEAKTITYKWELDDVVVDGETSMTLKIAKLESSLDTKVYKCTAKDADGEDSDTVTMAVKGNDDSGFKPAISGDGARYGLGDEYTLSCDVTEAASCSSITYEWKVDSNVQSGETGSTFKYTATDTSQDITCSTKVGETASTASDAVSIGGNKIASVTVVGTTNPVVGVEAEYTCSVVRSKDKASETITYAWSEDADQGTTNEVTYKHTDGTADTSRDLKCEATVDSENHDDTKAATAKTDPVAPTVSGPSVKWTIGGEYTMTCNTDLESSYSTVTYAWDFGGNAYSACTAKECKISSVKSSDAGDYKCKVKVGDDKESALSSALTVQTKEGKGVECTAVANCASLGDDFSGNCIASFCECADNGPKTYDGCSKGSGTQITISMLSLVMSAVIGYLVKL